LDAPWSCDGPVNARLVDELGAFSSAALVLQHGLWWISEGSKLSNFPAGDKWETLKKVGDGLQTSDSL
jgi:hypothetical protein